MSITIEHEHFQITSMFTLELSVGCFCASFAAVAHQYNRSRFIGFSPSVYTTDEYIASHVDGTVGSIYHNHYQPFFDPNWPQDAVELLWLRWRRYDGISSSAHWTILLKRRYDARVVSEPLCGVLICWRWIWVSSVWPCRSFRDSWSTSDKSVCILKFGWVFVWHQNYSKATVAILWRTMVPVEMSLHHQNALYPVPAALPRFVEDHGHWACSEHQARFWFLLQQTLVA